MSCQRVFFVLFINKMLVCLLFFYNIHKPMKTLLDNLYSDLLQNQVFQTGFRFLTIVKGSHLPKMDSNVLIFIMSGTMKVFSGEKELAIIDERHIFFWDKENDHVCEMLSDTQVILFAFGDLIVHDLLTFRPYASFQDKSALKGTGLRFAEPLNSFLQLLVLYLEMKLDDVSLYITKRQELFYILNSVYNEQELAILFSSLTEQSSKFKEQILENYLSAKNVGELASLLGYGVTNFRVKFKEQFGVSVYRWLLNRKSQRIIYRITVYGDEFSQIIDDFGFSSPSHFNKFCRSQYGLTPCELRKKLKTNNNS